MYHLSDTAGEMLVIVRGPGDLIGEMAMWQPGEGRTATMKGDQPGLMKQSARIGHASFQIQ